MSEVDVAAIGRDLSTLGRDQLLALVKDLTQRAADRDVYLENLNATQKRCSELLFATRAMKELAPLAEAMGRARYKHPNGCRLRSLVEEVGEYAKAMRHEGIERQREELIDVAVVAMRLHAGEIDDAG